MGALFAILSMLGQLTPAVIQVIKGVQSAFPPGTGPVKKELVKGMVLDTVVHAPEAKDVPPELLDAIIASMIDRQAKAVKATLGAEASQPKAQ